MNGNKRVFVAAWEYPPIMSGESVVCRRTLENSTFQYDVCCGAGEQRENGRIRLYPEKGHKYLVWPFKVLHRFRTLDKQEHYQIMMSRVMPPNGHLAGWFIKRIRPDIKWVAYFSDPIWNSPFLKFSLRRNEDHRPNWLLMKLFGIPAKWAVHESDALVFNNERLAKYVLGTKYDRYKEKVVIAPYGHDGVHPRPAAQRCDGKFRLTHVGQIYGNRTFADLLTGLELLQEREPELFKKLEVRQVGFVCKKERKRVENSAARIAFTFIEQVPYEQSIEEMYNADCLLVIDPSFDDPRKNIYVPGKIYDYMSTGRPIICIADEDSATGDVAKYTGREVMISPYREKLFELICTCYKNKNKNEEFGEDQVPYKALLCSHGIKQLDKLLGEL